MKKLLLLALLVSTASAYAQGTVFFANRHSSEGVAAPISFAEGGPAPAGYIDGGVAIPNADYVWGGVNAKAGLYGGPLGTAEEHLLLLNPTAGFRSDAPGYLSITDIGTRTVADVAPGSSAVFQIRAWDVGISGIESYEAALDIAQMRSVYLGKSSLVTIAHLGGNYPNWPPVPPPSLIGLEWFSLYYVNGEQLAPEPSTFALGLISIVAGLACFRRSK